VQVLIQREERAWQHPEVHSMPGSPSNIPNQVITISPLPAPGGCPRCPRKLPPGVQPVIGSRRVYTLRGARESLVVAMHTLPFVASFKAVVGSRGRGTLQTRRGPQGRRIFSSCLGVPGGIHHSCQDAVTQGLASLASCEGEGARFKSRGVRGV